MLKINDNSTSRKYYLIKKAPRKNGYTNSMLNIKGMNIHKSNNHEINKYQFFSNKIGNSYSNLKDNYSQLKFNDYKRISPQNKKYLVFQIILILIIQILLIIKLLKQKEI